MFRSLLRPGQGFRRFEVKSRTGGVTEKGRAYTGSLQKTGEIIGIISQASQKEVEQWKQNGHPITHTIVQHGSKDRAKATDVLHIPDTERNFLVQGVQDPGELGHFTIYHVEERVDLK